MLSNLSKMIRRSPKIGHLGFLDITFVTVKDSQAMENFNNSGQHYIGLICNRFYFNTMYTIIVGGKSANRS